MVKAVIERPMSKTKKLTKVIERAVEREWKRGKEISAFRYSHVGMRVVENYPNMQEVDRDVEHLLFSHDYSNAYCGEE